MRLVIIAAVAVAFGSSVFLYALSYDTRRMEAGVRGREQAAETARVAIAILRAERARLARPSRIEPLARALGLGPAAAAQFTMPPGHAGASPGAAPVAPGDLPR